MLSRKIAYVDLTQGTVKTEEVPLEWRKKFLGGRGINTYLLNKLIGPDTDPMGPENVVIFGVGLLSGVPGFGTGRFNITGLSPECGNLGESSIGGQFGAEMSLAGFHHVVVTGKSNSPCYLMVTNGKIEIRDAKHLWGKDTWETQVQIKKDTRDERTRAISIGVAGENLVKYANVMSGPKDAAGRTGMGCLMGSKNLKAVAARGSQDIKLAYPQELEKYFKEQIDLLMTRKWIKALGKLGTPLLLAVANEGGWILQKNEEGSMGEQAEPLYAERMLPYSNGMSACYGCAVHCRHRHHIKEGKYAGTRGEGPEYGGLAHFGVDLGSNDLEAVISVTDLCNKYGLAFTAGSYVAFAMELYERGILTAADIGRPLRFGDMDAVHALVTDIAYRKGFGDVLADAVYCLDKLPSEAGYYFNRIKNMPVGGPGGRVVKSFSFAQAVSTLGGHAHRNRPGIDVLGLPAEVLQKLYGGYVSPSFRSYEGKSLMVWWHELLYSICDGMGCCRFQTVFNSPNAPQYGEYAELARLAAGLELPIDELKEIAERIYTTERLFLVKRGVGDRKDDAIPPRWIEEEVASGAGQGERLDPERFQQFLDEYYQLHGWDSNGHPTPALLKKLDIEDIAPANL